MTGDLWTAPPQGPDLLSALTEDERYRRFDELQARMPGVWDAMRLNHDDESVVVVPSISLDRAVCRQRQPVAGLRGAVPLPARSAAPTAAADGLRDVDADRPGDRGVLPRAAQRRHPEPRPGAPLPHLRQRRVSALAEREAAGAAPAAAPDRRPRAQPGSLAHGPLQHDRARARRRAEHRHPDVRRGPTAGRARVEDRMPTTLRRGRGPAPAWAPRTCTASTRSPMPWSRCGGNARPWPAPSSSSTRVSRVRERRGDPDRAAEPRFAGREGRGDDAPPAHGPGVGVHTVRGLCRQVRRGWRDRGGAHHRTGAAEPECPAPGPAQRRGRAALHPRPAARRAQRAEVPRMRVPRRRGVRAAHHRRTRSGSGSGSPGRAHSAGSRWTSSWSATPVGRGRRTPSSSTCARAARPIRSSRCSS